MTAQAWEIMIDCRLYFAFFSPERVNINSFGDVQDCWRPHYKEDYDKFYAVLKKLYPNLILIANCDLGQGSKTELYDWHTYDDSQTM